MQPLDDLKLDQATLVRWLHDERPRNRTPQEVDDVFLSLRANFEVFGLPLRAQFTVGTMSEGLTHAAPRSEFETVCVYPGDFAPTTQETPLEADDAAMAYDAAAEASQRCTIPILVAVEF